MVRTYPARKRDALRSVKDFLAGKGDRHNPNPFQWIFCMRQGFSIPGGLGYTRHFKYDRPLGSEALYVARETLYAARKRDALRS